MIDNDLYKFLEEYLAIFLELINFHLDDDFFEELHNSQNVTFSLIDEQYADNLERKKQQIDNYTQKYNNELIEYVRTQIAEPYPEFFNQKINELKTLLSNNKEYAAQNAMKIDTDYFHLNFADYYNNYLIVLDKISELGNQDTNKEE